MFSFFANLFRIGRKLPTIVAVVRSLIDVIGSEQVQFLLETIRGALEKETPDPEHPPETEPERIRLTERLLRRLGLSRDA